MLEAALTEFQRAIGSEHTLTSPVALQRYQWSTDSVERRFPAVVRPASVEEVQAIVRIARTHHVPLYPISTGNNWGYGSAQPTRDGAVIVDLGRMNAIVELNTELAYVVLEPGVTQQQLFDHLATRQIPLWLNPTGAGPTCSILGNTLERGFGIGPNGDHFHAQCGMEVVLGTGEVLHTGFGHYPGARATYAYKYGVGPYLDGLFTQSSYGIVTKMGVWLTPRPEHFESCYITCNSEEQLGPVIDALRQLLFTNAFTGPFNLLHRNRVLIMLGQYPWEAMQGQTPLAEDVARRLAAERNVGIWNGVGAICGTKAQVAAARKTIARAFRGKVDRLAFLSDRRLDLLRRHPRLIGTLTRMNVPQLLATLERAYGMMKGTPSEVALSLSYWRNRRMAPPKADINPARDNCGVLWFAPIIPMTEGDVSAFRRTVEPILARHGLDTCITLTAVNERCFDCTLPLLFDRDDPSEVEKAQACYVELHEACRERGYVPYRLGLHSMDAEMERDDVFWRVVTRMKGAFDPEGILAPGRYAC